MCPVRLAQRVYQEAAQSSPLIGMTLRNRYKITQMLGKGAMGVVYKASQLSDGKDVAIKVLHTHLASDQESLKRFQHEARAASSLLHPHIVRLYEVGMIPGGQPYLAMEYLEGKTLAELIREKKFFRTREALPIIRQTCEALAEAHGHGVLHRDIKPANIMLLNRFGQNNFVVVLDFSISKVIQRVSDVDTTTPGLIFGSPAYMSPERFMGRGGDFRADIYSMGVIIFQMLAGRAPFKSKDLYTLMNEHVNKEPPRVKDIRPDSDIPEALAATIARALAKKPEDRHANMKALLSEINDIAGEMSTSTSMPVLPSDSPVYPLPANGTAGATSGLPVGATTAAGGTSGGGNFGSAQASKESSTSTFEIDPGVALTLDASIPSCQAAAQRKQVLEEQQKLRLSDNAPINSTFDRSLIARRDGDRREADRPNIRPQGQWSQRPPLEVIALGCIMLLGIGIIFFSAISSSSPRDAFRAARDANDVPRAITVVKTWRINESDASDTAAYADALLWLSKTLADQHKYDEAADYVDLIPSTATKQTREARELLRRWRKPSG
jgi:serine/threonine protein kinase